MHRSPPVILEEYGLVALPLGSGRASVLPREGGGERYHRFPFIILEEFGLVALPHGRRSVWRSGTRRARELRGVAPGSRQIVREAHTG